MLFKCWAHVADGGPTLKRRWVNVSFLLSNVIEMSRLLHFGLGTGVVSSGC